MASHPLSAAVLVAGECWAGEMKTPSEGRYYLQSDILSSGLCDIVKTNDIYILTHIERHNIRIKLKTSIDH